MLTLVAVPAVIWAKAGPPRKPGRLVGAPNGLESVAIKYERLAFDLRPLARAGPALVEAVYETENTGEPPLQLLPSVVREHCPTRQMQLWRYRTFQSGCLPGAISFACVIPPSQRPISTGASPLLHWQLVYILAPAREWAGFGGPEVQVQLPEGWRFAGTLPLTRSGDQLTGSFSGLPADAIAITAQRGAGREGRGAPGDSPTCQPEAPAGVNAA